MDFPPEDKPVKPADVTILLRYQASDREYAIFREIKAPAYSRIGDLVKQLGVDSLTRWNDERGERVGKPMRGAILKGGTYDIAAASSTNCFEDMVRILTEFNYKPKKVPDAGKPLPGLRKLNSDS